MTVRRQHFVPKVYLKNWETIVTNKKEPNKKFEGVYYYEKNDLTTGDGRNKDSILWAPRLYNVDYDISFIIPSCPIIEKDYIKKIEEKLKERQVNTYYEGKCLKNQQDLKKDFLNLDDWEFKYKQHPYNLAKKNAIINDIKQINSYVIEKALDDVVEKKWQQTLNDFIYQMENTIPLNGVDEIRQINEDTVIEILRMVIFLICRNPEFNCLEIFPVMKQFLLDNLPKAADIKEQKDREEFINHQMNALFLVEIYKGLFGVQSGYFYTLKQTAQSSFQIMLYKCLENQGAFITSDKPAFEHISLVEKINLNSIICPLSPQYLIMIMKGESNSLRSINFRRANNELIKKLNRITLSHAQNAIISNYKHLGYIL